jgi:PAS domain S-box-containing protein
VADKSELLGLSLFVAIGGAISALNEAWRRAAMAVTASEGRLRVTLSSIGDGVITTDADGRVTSLNPVAEALTGWTTAEAAGLPLDEVFVILHETSRQPVENPVYRVLRDRAIAGLANHTVLVAKDGREIPIDDSAAPIVADGDVVGVVLIFRDIAERRRGERAREDLLDRERTARNATERVADELRQVQAITDVAVTSLSIDELIRAVLGRIRASLQSDTATILMLEGDGTHLTPFASDGLEAEIGGEIHIPIGRGVAGRIALSREPAIFDDLSQVEVVSPILRNRVRSLVGVPLKSGNRLIGVMHAGASSVRRFTAVDGHLLSLAADRVGVAIERAHLHEAEQTAHRVAEKATEQLRVALESGQMGTWEYVIRSGVVKWSPGLEAIHGYPPGTFPGTFEAFRNEIHPEDRERVLHAIREAAAERRDHHIEYRIVRADGTVRWVEGRGQLFLDEAQQPDRMVGVCSDISERKRADERFRLAVEAAPAAMLMVDQRGRVVLANPLSEQVLGYSRAEILG